MELKKSTGYKCHHCGQTVGHAEGCKGAEVADLVMAAPDGRDELRRLAEKATPGPWAVKLERWVIPAAHIDRHIGGSTEAQSDFEDYAHPICSTSCKYQPNRDNAAFIAAANPQAILALLDENAKLRAGLAAPASPASAPEASERMPTDLSKRLRETAKTPASKMYLYSQIMCQAADEIERYYGGMMAWKRTAEAKDAAPLPPVVARKDGAA